VQAADQFPPVRATCGPLQQTYGILDHLARGGAGAAGALAALALPAARQRA